MNRMRLSSYRRCPADLDLSDRRVRRRRSSERAGHTAYYTLEYKVLPARSALLDRILKIKDAFRCAPEYDSTPDRLSRGPFSKTDIITVAGRPGDLIPIFWPGILHRPKRSRPFAEPETGRHIASRAESEFYERDAPDQGWSAVVSVAVRPAGPKQPDVSKRVLFQKIYGFRRPAPKKRSRGSAVSQAVSGLSAAVFKDVYSALADSAGENRRFKSQTPNFFRRPCLFQMNCSGAMRGINWHPRPIAWAVLIFISRNLVMEEQRLERFSLKGGGIFYDFSRQRVDRSVMRLLWELGACRNLQAGFQAMMRGEIVNRTESRAALHTASRSFSDLPVHVAGQDVMPEIRRVREEIRRFSQEVHSGRITGSTGKPFRDIVTVGIGGSYLGTQFAANALEARALKGMRLHYLSNVDIDNFGQIVSEIDPEAALWVIISKSYTTSETTANTNQATEFMRRKGLDPARHFVTVTSKGSPGDDPANPVLQSFHMFDFIGGRYSVCSAVGGVPLSLYLGYDCFERFLKGAEEMDIHAATAPIERNIPINAALLSIWNNNFLKYSAQGIIPYAASLSRLAPHVQQLYMESNGKSVTASAQPIECDTGIIVFGEPGTNAQHSFFQLAHPGPARSDRFHRSDHALPRSI